MKLELLRDPRSPNQIPGSSVPGHLKVDGLSECFTLERAGVEIPVGEYHIRLVTSPHMQRELPQLENVPGRTEIDIHSGNIPADSKGCVLVGQSRTNDGMGLAFPAHPAEVALTLKIKAALSRMEPVTISVEESV